MKIVSKFQDYYDIGLSMGVDESLVYVRNLEAKVLPNYDLPFSKGYYARNQRVSRIAHILRDIAPLPRFGRSHSNLINLIGFCGKLYPFIFVDYYTKNYERVVGARYHVDKTVLKEIQETYMLGRYAGYRETKEETIEILNGYLDNVIEAPEMFHELKTPSFILPSRERVERFLTGGTSPEKITHGDYVWVNPCLKDFNFYQKFDAFTAFQEISMFITGVLGENKIPPVQISDVDMRDAKGFNDRSFKKEPTKKRKR